MLAWTWQLLIRAYQVGLFIVGAWWAVKNQPDSGSVWPMLAGFVLMLFGSAMLAWFTGLYDLLRARWFIRRRGS